MAPPGDSAIGTAARVGVVGIGHIGAGVATSLTRGGLAPVLYDVRRDALASRPDLPSMTASLSELVEATDIVLIAVATDAEVEAVVDSVLDVGRPGIVIAVLSTISVRSLRRLAETCAARNVHLLDAAVTGGDRAAANGLVVMVGGPADVVRTALPVLERFAKAVVHCGPVGAGMAAKLARNALTYASWAVFREAVELAIAAGISIDAFLRIVEEGLGSSTAPHSLQQMQRSGIVTPESAEAVNRLAQKDLAAAQELAAELGVAMPHVGMARPEMPAVLRGESRSTLPADVWERGLEMMDRVYGPGYSAGMARDGSPLLVDVVAHLFADVWSRPQLTVRERRLLVMGATAALGRGDLLAVQLRGAVANGELGPVQLAELPLALTYYVGIQNAGTVQAAVDTVLGELAAAERDGRPDGGR
jgi:3-hydroxyisobutyrate dehydrogenase-like beta-hydroxyacid dehydrogenase